MLIQKNITFMKAAYTNNATDDFRRRQRRRRIHIFDRQIDALVCELYGLTEEEVKIVEGEKCLNYD